MGGFMLIYPLKTMTMLINILCIHKIYQHIAKTYSISKLSHISCIFFHR
jgi:hypothetical protein